MPFLSALALQIECKTCKSRGLIVSFSGRFPSYLARICRFFLLDLSLSDLNKELSLAGLDFVRERGYCRYFTPPSTGL